jgi:hypothetical protein
MTDMFSDEDCFLNAKTNLDFPEVEERIIQTYSKQAWYGITALARKGYHRSNDSNSIVDVIAILLKCKVDYVWENPDGFFKYKLRLSDATQPIIFQ